MPDPKFYHYDWRWARTTSMPSSNSHTGPAGDFLVTDVLGGT